MRRLTDTAAAAGWPGPAAHFSNTGGAVATGGNTISSGGASGGESGGQTGGVSGPGSGGSATAAGCGGGSAGSAGGAGSGGAQGSAGASGAGGGTGVDGGTVPDAGGGTTDGGPPPTGKVIVWLAGDSTMQPCTTSCPCGWGSQFQPLFNSNATVKNLAVGGRSIQSWLYESNVTNTMSNGECVVSPKTFSSRWQAMLRTWMKAGDYLFIQFGINDSDSSCDRHVGIDAFKMSYGMMAQAAKERGAQPDLADPAGDDPLQRQHRRPAATVRDRDEGRRHAVRRSGDRSERARVALYKQRAFCPIPGGDVSATTTGPVGDFFCDDHTHLSSSGAPISRASWRRRCAIRTSRSRRI